METLQERRRRRAAKTSADAVPEGSTIADESEPRLSLPVGADAATLVKLFGSLGANGLLVYLIWWLTTQFSAQLTQLTQAIDRLRVVVEQLAR